MRAGALAKWLLFTGLASAMPGLRRRQAQTSVDGCTCPSNGLTTTTLVQYTVFTSSTTVTTQGSTSFSTGSTVTQYTATFPSITTVITDTTTITRPGVTENVIATSAITSTITAATALTTCVVSASRKVKRQATGLTTVASPTSNLCTFTTTSTIGSRIATCACLLRSRSSTLAGTSTCQCPATTTTTVTVSSIATTTTIVAVTIENPTVVTVIPSVLSTIVIPDLVTSSSLATVETTQSSLTVTSQSIETIFALYTPTVFSCPAVVSAQIVGSSRTTTSSSTTSTRSVATATGTGTFVCNSTAYYIGSADTGPIDLYNINLSTGVAIILARSVGAGTYSAINALGYNPLDNYLYAVAAISSTSYAVIRLTITGNIRQILTFTAETQPTSGDVDTDGQFYFTSFASGNTAWFHVDLAPGSTTFGKIINSGTSSLSGYNVYDWAYLIGQGDYMYSLAETTDSTPNFAILRWNQNTHVWSLVQAYPNSAAPNFLVANWGSSNGTLWGLAGNTGQVTRVSLGGSPVQIGPGPTGLSRGDGARCGLAS